MPTRMNSVVHFDIPVSDPAASSKYYQDLFGWKIDEIPGANYSMVYTTELDPVTKRASSPGINGGMAKVSDAGDIHQAYFTVEVEDVQAMLDKAVAMGGKVVRPFADMGDWGQMAVFTDPDGNLIGLHHGM